MPDPRSVELTASLLAALRAALSAGAVVVPDPALPPDVCGVPEAVARRVLARRGEGGVVLVSRPGATEPGGVGAFRARVIGGEAVALAPGALVWLGASPGEVVRVHGLLSGASRREALRRLRGVRRPRDGELRPLLSADARLGLAYLALRVEGERGEAPRPQEPPLPGERADRGAWGEYARAVRRWQLTERGRLEGFFASDDELQRASEAGAVAVHAGVFVRRPGGVAFTTPGRSRIEEALAGDQGEGGASGGEGGGAGGGADPGGERWGLVDEGWSDGPRPLDRALAALAGREGDEAYRGACERLERLGLAHATRSGASLALDHLPVLSDRHMTEAHRRIAEVSESFEVGLITDGERYNKVVDVWSDASEQAYQEVARRLQRQPGEAIAPAHLLSMMLRVAPVGEASSPSGRAKRMLGFVLAAKPSGEIHEVPVREGLREGVGPHGALMLAAQARRRSLSEAHEERWVRSLRDVLLRALGDVRVVARDCGASRPLWVSLDGVRSEEPGLADRLAGRTLAGSLRWRGDREEGERLDEATRRRWQAVGPWQVPIRSPVTCEAEGGVCAVCLGEGPGGEAAVGDPVGLWAAEAIGEAARSLAGRRSSLGWGASPGWPLGVARGPGVVCLEPAGDRSLAVNSGGQVVVMSGLVLRLVGDGGDEVQREALHRGDVLRVADGERVEANQGLLEREDGWAGRAVLAEGDGWLRWCDIVWQVQVDAVMGLARHHVSWRPGVGDPPRLVVEGPGREQVVHWLDHGAELRLDDGTRVRRGDTLAWLAPGPGLASRQDAHDQAHALESLLRGCPEAAGLLLSEVSGSVSLETTEVSDRWRRWRRAAAVVVTPRDGRGRAVEGLAHRHELAAPGLTIVQDGDEVRAGDVLAQGPMDPRQLLRVLGPGEAARRVVDRMLALFGHRGQALRPAYAELLVRALLGFVRVTTPGDGPWAPGERVRWTAFFRQNEAIEARGGRPARAEAVVTNLARVRGEGVAQSSRPPDTTR